MRHNISADRVLFFKKRKKSNLNLSQISVLATEARNNIDENQQLSDAITILNNLLQKTKKIIKTLISKKNIPIFDMFLFTKFIYLEKILYLISHLNPPYLMSYLIYFF